MKVIKDKQIGEAELELVVETLKKGGLIVYPTETVYGLGVDACSEAALERLWQFKGERGDKPVLVAVGGMKMAEEYVQFSQLGKKVVQKYWPGAVAVVSTSLGKVAKKAQGVTETLGLRMPDNNLVLDLIGKLGKPMTSTSANISGGMTARSLAEFELFVPEEKREMVDIFIDAGELPPRPPSTIVDTTREELKILRQGEVTVTLD